VSVINNNGYSTKYCFDNIICISKEMDVVKELAARVAKSNSTVLILGENGTGKELIAQSIHQLSTRRSKPFVAVNCAAIPEDLFESELFGYETGAFSGAKKDGKVGKFELANGGTLFLDEISELPYHMQGKLLRVLQEKEIERVGGVNIKKVDVRIIAASNQNMRLLIENKKFRQDLYYRLRVFPIVIPPLRKRIEDINYLATYFVNKICKELSKNPVILTEGLKLWLQNYEFKGNVRELKNLMEATVQLTDSDYLDIHHILPLVGIEDELNEEDVIHSLKEEVERAEKNYILKVLSNFQGDYSKTAKQLGIHHSSLYRKLEKYGINREIMNT
jgi:transcriptional regulator with PAS, ATPase and Fis domain